MTDPHLIATLKSGAPEWNVLRKSMGTLPIDLSAADLHHFRLDGVNLAGVGLTGANLDGASLEKADLTGADLTNASLRRASLQRATLSDACLRGANLFQADLRHATANNADLRGANLSAAQLQRASLRGADLSEANVGGADFSYADLRDARLLAPTGWAQANTQGIRKGGLRRGWLVDDVVGTADGRLAMEYVAGGSSVVGQFDPQDPLRRLLEALVPWSSSAGSPLGDTGRITMERAYAQWTLRIPLPGLRDDYRFVDEEAVSGLRRLFSGGDVVTGDQVFDDEVHVQGPPGQILARLDVVHRQIFLGWVRAGGTISVDGIERPVPDSGPDSAEWNDAIRAGCCIAYALARPMKRDQVELALLVRAHEDPMAGVRQRALAVYLEDHSLADGIPDALLPQDVEAVVVSRLADPENDRRRAAAQWLGANGSVGTLKPLLAIANATFVNGAVKQAAQDAAEAILERHGGARAGGLSVLEGGAEGGVSLSDQEE